MASSRKRAKVYNPSKELVKLSTDVVKIGVTVAATSAILGTTAKVVDRL